MVIVHKYNFIKELSYTLSILFEFLALPFQHLLFIHFNKAKGSNWTLNDEEILSHLLDHYLVHSQIYL